MNNRQKTKTNFLKVRNSKYNFTISAIALASQTCSQRTEVGDQGGTFAQEHRHVTVRLLHLQCLIYNSSNYANKHCAFGRAPTSGTEVWGENNCCLPVNRLTVD